MKPASRKPHSRLSLAAITCLGILSGSCSGERPADLGVNDGRLRPCPDSPNCVCSYDNDTGHAIAPLQTDMASIASMLTRLDRVTIITQRQDYLHAEFSSRLFGFVDDVEFLGDPGSGIVHVRSASRLGYSDMGVNRKRIEMLRGQLHENR